MPTPFYVWSTNVMKPSACSYYRITVPMHSISQRNYCKLYEFTGNAVEESNMALFYSDIAHMYNVAGEQHLHTMQVLKNVKPSITEHGPLYPPAIIYDTDDNTDFVHPFNMTYVHLGTRGYPDGKLLTPREGLQFTDHTGQLHALWVDGVTKYNGTVFDIKRNLHQMKVRHAIIKEAHGVTVSTPALARYMKQVMGVKNVHVYYNTIDAEHYDRIQTVHPDPSTIRILWQGGMSHYVDWYPLRDALKEISQKYQNVVWVIFGEWFDWIHTIIPDARVEHHPWVDHSAYHLKRMTLDIDINLCPLVNNAFNICKSGIKFYEASLPHNPEVTLAANVEPYKEIVDGETGLLYDTTEDFVKKLSTLIESAELRKRLAENAKTWVFSNRTPDQTAPSLFEFYQETRNRQKRDLGIPSSIKRATVEEIIKIAHPLR